MKKKIIAVLFGAGLLCGVLPVVTLAGGSFFIDDVTSYVGIGNTTPAARLDVSGAMYSRLVIATSSAINWNAGNVQSLTLSSNPTLTFSNGQAGGKYDLILTQDSTGGRTVTWPSSVKWSNGTVPTFSSAASSTNVFSFLYDGNYFLGSLTYAAQLPLSCTGGTVTTSGGNTIHTFTSSGNLTCTGAGNAEVLVVGGGGGGGSDTGGGGGAGGYQYDASFSLTSQTYSVTVGNGGNVSNEGSGGNGGDSIFASIDAIGGGGGAGNATTSSSGGSGGGGSFGSTSAGAAGTSGQGNSGGDGGTGAYCAGGGGGSNSIGEASSGNTCGNGGNGTLNSISGSMVIYAGGGGGGSGNSGSATSGGSGGGGAGSYGGTGTSGTANSGGGGGGGGSGGGLGGVGGSGIIIVSYPTF